MAKVLVRHCEATFNVEKRIQGQCNHSKLTPNGFRQSLNLKIKLHSLYPEFDRIVSSDLLRAKETSVELANGKDIIFDNRFREISRGLFEGTKSDGFIWRMYKSFEKRGIDLGRFLIGLESLQSALDRFESGIHDVMSTDENTLIISHGEIMRLFWGKSNGLSIKQMMKSEEFQIPNGSIFEIGPNKEMRRVDG